MKADPPVEPEFNSPTVMLSRAVFLAMLAGFSGGVLLTIAGLVTAEARLALAGIGTLMVAGASRAWLQRRGEFEPADRALDEMVACIPPPDEARGRELLALLDQWEALEQKRGSADFDPWELQALRNDIRRVVASDPALERIFTELQRAA